MTPRELDPSTTQVKLRLMQDLVDDLTTIGDPDGARLREERLLMLAVERVLTALVDLSVAINSHVIAATADRAPVSYRESFVLAAEAGLIDAELAGELRLAVGMRNLLVHEYAVVDVDRVATALPLARQQFGQYIRDAAAWLSAR